MNNRLYFYLFLIIAWITPLFSQQVPPLRVLLLPFDDDAGFQGDWDLSVDVPQLLGAYLSETSGVEVVTKDSIGHSTYKKICTEGITVGSAGHSVALELGIDVLITGRIKKFGVRRAMAGDPNLIGYRSYTYSIELSDIDLIQVDSDIVLATLSAKEDSVERPIQFDLFGKPRVQDLEFRELLTVPFASKRFFELSFGKHAERVFKDISDHIVQTLLEREPLVLTDSAKVLAINGEEVFLGIGKDNLVQHGDVLPLLDSGQHVGIVRVKQILGPHLSKAIVVDHNQPIHAGLGVGQRLVPGQSKN